MWIVTFTHKQQNKTLNTDRSCITVFNKVIMQTLSLQNDTKNRICIHLHMNTCVLYRQHMHFVEIKGSYIKQG